MKKITLFLMIMTVVVIASAQKTPPKNKVPGLSGNGILLSYVGELTGTFSVSIGIYFQIDSSIGFVYNVAMERGKRVLSHTAFYYKFSDPTNMIQYNYLTHKTFVHHYEDAPSASELKVDVVATPTIGGYSCTQLRHTNDNQVENYWMSPSVPGFKELLGVFNQINPDWVSIGVNGTIFNWGGLVRMTSDFSAHNTTGHFDLELKEATKGLYFPPSSFAPPTK